MLKSVDDYLDAARYEDAERHFASGNDGRTRTAPLIEVLGLIHDDVWVLRELTRSLITLHDPKFFSANPEDHLGKFEAPTCRYHGLPMVLRQAAGGGEFWGCPKFREGCRYTVSASRQGEQTATYEDPADAPGETNRF